MKPDSLQRSPERTTLMQEALKLQAQWERAIARLTTGRSFDELTAEERLEWNRLGVLYNEHIDKKLEEWKHSLNTAIHSENSRMDRGLCNLCWM
jgi:hypothetical protein